MKVHEFVKNQTYYDSMVGCRCVVVEVDSFNDAIIFYYEYKNIFEEEDEDYCTEFSLEECEYDDSLILI